MAISGVNFSINVDESKGIAGIKNFQSAMNSMTNSVQGEVSNKLKYIFSVTAIEEATRRTGEWAQQIQQTSKSLGISAEALQTLQLLASKTGTPEDAVVGMFSNIGKARDEALAGNTQLLISFQQLGVSLEDLRTKTKSDLFSQVIGNIPANVQTAPMIKRQSVQDVTGTPENFVNDITAEIKSGGDFSNYKNKSAKNGNIASDESIAEMSATWTDFKQSLKQTALTLIPIGKLLLGLAKMLASALGGLGTVFSGVLDLLQGNFKSAAQKIGGILVNSIFGFIKIFTLITDFAGQKILSLLSKLPGFLGGNKFQQMSEDAKQTNVTTLVSGLQNDINQKMGLNAGNKIIQQGEDLGNVAALIPGGEADLGKLANDSFKQGQDFGELFKSQTARNNLRGKVSNAFAKTDKNGIKGKDGIIDAEVVEENKVYRELNPTLLKGINGAGKIINGAALGVITNKLSNQNLSKGKVGIEPTPILPRTGLFGEVKGGDSSLLKFGGIFGTAFQSKMIGLTTQMVKILSDIQVNTQAGRGADINSSPGMGPAGGL